jgi:hypothetical protein
LNRYLAAGAAVCALALVPAQASASWLTPVSLGTTAFVMDAGDVSVGADGSAASVWAGGGGVRWAVDRPGSAVAKGTLAATGSAPHVAVDADGDAVAIWLNSSSEILAATRPAGGAWTSATPVSTASHSVSSLDVAVDAGGDAVAIWKEALPTSAIVSASLPAGGSWSAPATIDASAPVNLPALALDANGDATAIWIQSQSGGWYPTTSRLPKGGAWSAPVTVTTNYAETPAVGVDADGNATAGWVDHITHLAQVATQPASGGAWSAPEVLSNQTSAQSSLAVDSGGNALLAWKVATGVQAVTRSGGGGWSATQLFGVAASNAPRVAMQGGGNAILGWYTGTQRSSVAPYSPSEGWGAAADLGAGGTQAQSLQVAANEQGDGYAFFVDSTTSSLAPFGARLDAAGPELSGLSIPASAQVGEPLNFAVTATDRISALGTITWDFGDGATATGGNATHAFAVAGSYPVKVTATDALGNASVKSATVAVIAPPTDPGPGNGGGGGGGTTTTPPPTITAPPTATLVGLVPTAPATGLAITPTQALKLGCRLTQGTLQRCVIDVFATPRTDANASRVHGMRVAQATITPATATSAATVQVRLGATGRRMLKRHAKGLLLTVRSRATSTTGTNLRATDSLRVRLKR